MTQPHSCRRGDSGVRTGLHDRQPTLAVVVARPAGREMTCTSIGPDRRMTRLMTEPLNSSCQRGRALAPSTIWVAFSARARSTRVAGDVVARSPGGTRRRAPRAAARCAAIDSPAASSGPADRPVSATTWTPISSPLARWAMRAARRMRWSASGRAGEGDDDPLAGLPRPGDAVAIAVVLQRVVDAVGDPQQRQLAQRRQVAGPEVVAEGGVDLLRRRRRCRGPAGGAAPRAPCRRARSGRRPARRGRAPSRAGGCR